MISNDTSRLLGMVFKTLLLMSCVWIFIAMIYFPYINQGRILNTKNSKLQFQRNFEPEYDDAYFEHLDRRIAKATSVIYNRVPKCGSSAMLEILEMLRKRTKRYSFYSSRKIHQAHLNEPQINQFVEDLKHYKTLWMFQHHLHFINLGEYDMPMPIYINLVRDPTARFVSYYYFKRFEHPKPMSDERRKRTFDECVLQNHTECLAGKAFGIIPYFCGHDPRCLKPSIFALERAKHNLYSYYGVVGITEDLKASYELFEKNMPQFFLNISRIAQESLAKLKSKFKTHKKPASSQEALEEMRSRLALENEFYDFAKRRYIAFLKHYGVASSLLND